MRHLACLLALAALGCDSAPDASDAGSADAGALDAGAAPTDAGASDAGADPGACLEFARPAAVGDVPDPGLDELSGLAASRAHADALYAHNDSGDGARVYVLDAIDASYRGAITLDGAAARDWEDIAVGPGPDGAPWVWAGDTGDNAAREGRGGRASITVYRFAEASVDASGPIDASITAEAIELTYPDAPHDCESVAVSEAGDLYLLTKEDSGPSSLFVARAPQRATMELELVTTIDIGGALAPGSRNATAMDLTPSGRGLLVRTYNRVHLFVLDDGETWSEALAREALRLPAAPEVQGEAIAWRPDGRAFFTISEGSRPTLQRYDAATPGCRSL